MKALLQRVSQAKVEVAGEVVGSIGAGLCVFLGVEKLDTQESAEKLAKKISDYRIFEDGQGKMNRSILDVGGEILVISQFTLCADTQKGTRPSFDPAAPPERAHPIYLHFLETLKKWGFEPQTGSFGELMSVTLTNQGPATFLVNAS